MKRDKDLLREILLALEEKEFDGRHSRKVAISFPDHTNAEVMDHCRMLIQAGFIEGQIRSGPALSTKGVTFDGHEFLDSVRDPSVWEHTKTAASKVGDASLGVMKDIAVAYLKSKLGLDP